MIILMFRKSILILCFFVSLFLNYCSRSKDGSSNSISKDKFESITFIEYLRDHRPNLIDEFTIIPAVAIEIDEENVFELLINNQGLIIFDEKPVVKSLLKDAIRKTKIKSPNIIIKMGLIEEENVPTEYYLQVLNILKSSTISRISIGKAFPPPLPQNPIQ